MKQMIIGFAILAGLLAAAPSASGQAAQSSITNENLRELRTTSPRSTLQSFILLTNQMYDLVEGGGFIDRDASHHRPLIRSIFDCMDIKDIPAFARMERAGEVAVCIKEILDRADLPRWEDIPGEDEIAAAEDPAKFDTWQVPGTRITIVRITEGEHKNKFQISSDTVERAVADYEDIAVLPYRRTGPARSEGFYTWYLSASGRSWLAQGASFLPDWMKTTRVRGVTVWKWVAIVLSGLLAILVFIVIVRIQRFCVSRVDQRGFIRFLISFIMPLAAITIPLFWKDFIENDLLVRGTVLYVLSFGATLISILVAILACFAIANRIAELVILSPRIRPEGLDAQLVRIVCKMAGVIGAVLIFLIGGQYLGIPLATLLASAGVGGLAIALAAQDMLKTLFGTVMLMADKPFRAGDRIVIGKYDGFVEEIGLRSTRLRLLTGHQATIPNDELARSDVENIGRRPHIRRSTNLRLPLNTPREKVVQAVEIIRSALENHEGMSPDRPPRVYFNEFNDEGFNIRLMYWYSPADYWKFLAFSEQINLKIFDEFDKAGIRFVLPMQIRDVGPDSSTKETT